MSGHCPVLFFVRPDPQQEMGKVKSKRESIKRRKKLIWKRKLGMRLGDDGGHGKTYVPLLLQIATPNDKKVHFGTKYGFHCSGSYISRSSSRKRMGPTDHISCCCCCINMRAYALDPNSAGQGGAASLLPCRAGHLVFFVCISYRCGFACRMCTLPGVHI